MKNALKVMRWALIIVLIGIIASAVILILGKPAVDALKDYRKQRQAGKDPHFKAQNIGLTNTDCWK